jgi:hypothetical protein
MPVTCATGREYTDGRRERCLRAATFSIGTDMGEHIAGACSQHLALVLRAIYDQAANDDDLEGPFVVVPLA